MEELPQPAIDPAKYRVLQLEYMKPGSDEVMTLALLRPASVVEGLGRGDTIGLNILELDLEGNARVLAILPCP